MKKLIFYILTATSLFASILDQPFITITNNNVTINNEADLLTYIGRLNDSNLTTSYQETVVLVDTIYNPYFVDIEKLFSPLNFW